MRFWISIAAWTLVPFGAIGLLWSLFDFSLYGIALNLALIAVGVHDIWQLKCIKVQPERWRWLALSQIFIGILIGGSVAWLGWKVEASEVWERSRAMVIEAMQLISPADQPLIEQAVDQTLPILKWGLVLGGTVIFLSQMWTAYKAFLLARQSQPPPLPGKA